VPKEENGSAKILLVECKVKKTELSKDIEKFKDLANNPDSLYFVCLRCKKFSGGPKIGVNYEELSKKDSSNLPIEFAFAYQSETGKLDLPKNINKFRCHEFCFTEKELV